MIADLMNPRAKPASGVLRHIDAGPLRRARELEGFQFLHMTLQQTLRTNWSSATKILG
jgi:8-hydroxy-5-deazaflavin:NADPH oxidoreductase